MSTNNCISTGCPVITSHRHGLPRIFRQREFGPDFSILANPNTSQSSWLSYFRHSSLSKVTSCRESYNPCKVSSTKIQICKDRLLKKCTKNNDELSKLAVSWQCVLLSLFCTKIVHFRDPKTRQEMHWWKLVYFSYILLKHYNYSFTDLLYYPLPVITSSHRHGLTRIFRPREFGPSFSILANPNTSPSSWLSYFRHSYLSI